jgi:transposase
VNLEHRPLRQAVAAAAPAVRPKGLGALSCEEIQREVCDWQRFKNRKAVGSYAGLVGRVSATGEHVCDLPITKAGNVRWRTLLIEAAWRWVVYQSQCRLVQRWRHILLTRAPTNGRANARSWPWPGACWWICGAGRPDASGLEDLGWVMVESAALSG